MCIERALSHRSKGPLHSLSFSGHSLSAKMFLKHNTNSTVLACVSMSSTVPSDSMERITYPVLLRHVCLGACLRSRYQLTYQQAQDMSEGKAPTTGPKDMPVNPRDQTDIQSTLSIFRQLTDKLRAARVQVCCCRACQLAMSHLHD